MRTITKGTLVSLLIIAFAAVAAFSPAPVIAQKADAKAKTAKMESEDSWAGKINDAFDVSKMSDMSDFDPVTGNPPTGDTIKIAYVNAFSGPAAINGHIHVVPIMFAAHDINKRGGIWVDGKKKLIEIIKADTMSKPDQTKKICERMILQEKVHFLMGTSGSNLMKIIHEVGNKYKVISVNEGSL